MPFTKTCVFSGFLFAEAGKATLGFQVGAKVEFPPHQIVCPISAPDILLEISNP